ncbi:MAG: VOC family protein [Candidatus Aminicenantes bacterium]|nr:VOC family protein [Candidatus Aminicenantes bacterium]
MHMACHHIGIFTRNPKRLIPFYTQGLGFSEGEMRVLPPDLMGKIFGLASECQLTKLSQDGAVIEVFSPVEYEVDDCSPRTSGYNHWGLEVEDKEAYVRILEERGVPVLKVDNRGRTIFFVKDPEGNLIEIYERKINL